VNASGMDLFTVAVDSSFSIIFTKYIEKLGLLFNGNEFLSRMHTFKHRVGFSTRPLFTGTMVYRLLDYFWGSGGFWCCSVKLPTSL